MDGSAQRRVKTVVWACARAPYRLLRRTAEALLDRRWRIETAGRGGLGELGPQAGENRGYEPTGWLDLQRILGRLEVGPEDVFLDLGCGKGRVLLHAARRPYRRVIGVELSEQFSVAARRNLAARRSRLRCDDVEVVTADVRDYRIPDDVTVVYVFNAFTGATFDAVIAQLLASVDRRPRAVRVIYLNPREHDRLARTGRFRLVGAPSRTRPLQSQADKTYARLYLLEPALAQQSLPGANVVVGPDVVTGGGGQGDVFGDDDDDVVRGGNGIDNLHGSVGDDELFGDGGRDRLDGDAGNDTLVAARTTTAACSAATTTTASTAAPAPTRPARARGRATSTTST